MAITRLTKTGQPVLGTTIEIETEDDGWQRCKVVGKGMGVGRYANTMVMAIVEWESDGARERTPFWPDVIWRPTERDS
jgi:hypothetical protein